MTIVTLLRSLFLGITLTASAAAQTPIPTTLLEEHAIATPNTAEAPSPGISSAASNGTDFLVATSTNHFIIGYSHALMLVDSAGRPKLDASHMFTGVGADDGVASNGRDFLVVWGGVGGTSGVRVSADGALLDPDPLVIHARTGGTTSLSHDKAGTRRVAWDGGQYVVLTTIEWLVTSPLLGIERSAIVTRVGENGQILQNDLEVDRGVNNTLAARNGISVIVWSAAGVFTRTMNAAGSLSDAAPISTGSSTANAIADGSDGFLVVWSDPSTAITAQHLDPGGKADAAPFTVSTTSSSPPAVTWDGTAYRVAWTTTTKTIQSVRVDAAGIIGSSAVTLADGTNPVLASNGASVLLVWSSIDGGTRARRADASGAGQLVHRAFNPQTLNAVGFTAGNASVAWTEVTSRLTNVRDDTSSPPIGDGTYTFVRGLDRPLIISGTTPPFMARYADDSAPPFAIPTRSPFWIGNGFLFLWTDAAPITDPSAVLPLYAQRLDASGRPIDSAPLTIGSSRSLGANSIGAAALYNGVFVGASNSEALVAYVDPAAVLRGVLLKGDQITDIGEIAPPQALANPIDITSDGQDFLVTWVSGMNGTNSYIASRRVLANGDMPDPIRIDSLGDDTKDSIATFWTGHNYLIVWSKRISENERQLWALRISQDGVLLDYPSQEIGTVNGSVPLSAYKDGLLVIA